MALTAMESGSGSFTSSSLREHYKCFLICILVALSNFQYGFDTAIVNGFQATQGFLRVFGVESQSGVFTIQTVFQQLITSLLQVGLILASLIIGPFSSRFGRRAGFVVASVIAFVGITIQVVVTTQWPLYIGRLLMGIANGIYVNMTVLYISEVAPAHLRGLMVSVFQPFVSIGSLVAAVVSNALHSNLTKHSYQVQLAILYAVPLFLFFVVPFLPESPRWCVVQGDAIQARNCLRRLRPTDSSPESFDSEITTIQEAVDLERKVASTVVWKDIWRGADLRRTLLSIACATFHASCGVNFIVGYGTFFFQIAGQTKPFTSSIIIQSVSVAGALIALPLARQFGRRPLLLSGFSASTICMFAVAVIYTVSPNSAASGKALVALLCIYLGAYSSTIGPLSWVTTGEMSSNHLRSYTFGVAMTIGFFFAWLIVFSTPYFINRTALNWGAKVAWIWAPSNLITVIFISSADFFLPETKGRGLEELDELFYNNVAARHFERYKVRDRIATHRLQSSLDLDDGKPETDIEKVGVPELE
ncbi:MFS transporter [Schizopora paradoxa]|uniref:MFS transporter n=1 Tax=Schizopora paradoxa TaxID=27342 RepID=A0A0H2SHM9_9AGAM|nr:MFS transporter [Schizopora paradoxa]